MAIAPQFGESDRLFNPLDSG